MKRINEEKQAPLAFDLEKIRAHAVAKHQAFSVSKTFCFFTY
jgi:hypothetical protein